MRHFLFSFPRTPGVLLPGVLLLCALLVTGASGASADAPKDPAPDVASGRDAPVARPENPNPADYLIRLSVISVDPARLDEYNRFLSEGVQAAMMKEPGVLVLYPMARKDAPEQIRILEIYASRDAYEKHIASAHFQKYKKGTQDMVKSLELLDMTALFPDLKIK